MNRTRKRLYRTIGFAILLIGIGYFVIAQLSKIGNKISGEYLQELITKESKGLYQLDFSDIDLSILNKSVHIKDITLFATPQNREDSINAKNIYEANIGNVKISLESVIRIYTHKELVVDGIEVIDPLLFMTKINPNKEPLKFGRETGELYDVISQYLEVLQINYLKVRSGTVNHSPSNFLLKAIDFNIENFEVSKDRKKKKIFYSEAINLGVSQQSILLPDSIHELSFESFELSTKDSILNFNNFRINPRQDVQPSVIFQQEKQNIYDIDIPTLQLQGINYLKAYEDNFLIVNNVNIPQPKIKIQSILKSKKQNTEQAENSIGASLLALFDLIKIKKLGIEKGGLNLTLKGDNQQRFISDNISIDLFDIELDSTQRDIQNIIHYFENASVEINDYDYLLPDNLHNIKFKKLNYNTLDSNLTVQNLEIKPSRSLTDSSLTQFNLNLPLLKMEGIAHRDIYDNNRIDLKNLALTDSKITITPAYVKNSEQQQSIITPQKLSGLLGRYFNEIKLNRFSVLNTDLEVTNLIIGESLNVQSHSLQIDSSFNSWHKIADSTFISGQGLSYALKTGQLDFKSFRSENNLHSLDLSDLNFSYGDLKDQIKVEYLSLKGIQLDSILNKKKVKVDSIALFKPEINFSYKELKQKKNNNGDWEFSKKPINIVLTEGKIKYQVDANRNLSIRDFDLELNYQKELVLQELLVRDMLLRDNTLKHSFHLAELRLPKNQSKLSLRNVEIIPFKPNDSLSISVNIPEINFTNFNKDLLLQKKRFEADCMLSKINRLNFNGLKSLENHFKTSDSKKTEYTFTVKNSNIQIEESNIVLLNEASKKILINTSGVNVELQNLNFPKNNNQTLYFVDGFTINNQSFDYFSSSKDTVSLRNLKYSSFTNAGNIEEFSYNKADHSTSLTIKGIQLKKAKIDNYIKENQVSIAEFVSKEVNLNLILRKEANKKLPQNIELPFRSLSLEKLLSNNINIKLYDEEKERNYFVRNADLLVNRLELDSTLTPKEIHHHLNSMAFSGENYRETFGKHYTVTAKEYSFQYPESNFEAHNIKMRSKYDRFEYSKHIKFQNDWFKLDLKALKLKKLDIDSLLIKKKFIVNKLELEQGNFTVFRDLNVPHNDNKKVPMPQTILSESDFAFNIDTVFVNSDINIHIMPKETSGIGTMTLNIDTGNIFNMRTHHFASKKPMILEAKGKLNKKAKFTTKVEFPMSSTKGDFHFIGNVGELDMTALNEMLIPLGAIEVRSGYNEEVNINFKGNDDYAQGIMEFRYNNLKIDILDRETYQSKGFGNNLKTIFANSFVVSSKNPRWFRMQTGNIFFERIESRSIFNFWAKSLLSGAVSSIGINNSKEEAKAYYKENQNAIDE